MSKKNQFDGKKSVKFRLVYRSSDDPSTQDKTLSDMVFSAIEPKKSQLEKVDVKAREKILSQFTKEDFGLVDKKTKEKAERKKRKEYSGVVADDVGNKIKGRDDLWITHLTRMKRKQDEEEEEKEEKEEKEMQEEKKSKNKAAGGKGEKKVRFAVQEKKGKNGDEDEEWESCEDSEEEWEDEDEDEEGIDEEEEGDEDEEEEESEIKAGKKGKSVKGDKKEESKTQTAKKDEEIPEKPEIKKIQEFVEEDSDKVIDFTKMKLAAGVKTKLYDEFGIPVDGYDYYKHIAEPGSGGPATFAFVAEYDIAPETAVDIDLKPNQMNAQQREVLAALEYEGADNAYEELEEDFMTMANEGLPCLVVKESKTEVKKGKTEAKKDKKISEITTDKSELQDRVAAMKKGAEPILASDKHSTKNEILKVIDDHFEVMRKKHVKEYKEEERARVAKLGQLRKTDKKGVHKKSYSSEEEEEDEDEEEEDDEEEEEEESVESDVDIRELDKDRIPFEEDAAMQQAMEEESADSDIDFSQYSESTRDNDTIPGDRVIVPNSRSSNLNIIKEAPKKKRKNPQTKAADTQVPQDSKLSKNGSEVEVKDAESSAPSKPEVEVDIFAKPAKETPEERKARKEQIKEAKQERKIKKKNFKETFENQKHKINKLKQAQMTSLAGYSVHKL